MANPHLEALEPTLVAMDSADVTQPGFPMAVFLQEAADLATLLEDPGVRGKILSVGLNASLLDNLHNDIEATRAAQSEWSVIRDRSKSAAQRDLEDKAYDFRKHVLAACRWNLRTDRVALATLSAISDGEGVEDLTQDLSDLATLMEQRAASFAGDTTFDAPAAVQQARAMVADLQAGISSERLTTEQASAKDLRDRAFTYLFDRVRHLREAGRYAFANDAAMARKFASAYRRRHRGRTEEVDAPTPVPPLET